MCRVPEPSRETRLRATLVKLQFLKCPNQLSLPQLSVCRPRAYSKLLEHHFHSWRQAPDRPSCSFMALGRIIVSGTEFGNEFHDGRRFWQSLKGTLEVTG